jgi:hypothetical protein
LLDAVIDEAAKPLKVDVIEDGAIDVAVDVRPGDESFAAPSDDDDGDLWIVLDRLERGEQIAEGLRVERVEPLLASEGK